MIASLPWTTINYTSYTADNIIVLYSAIWNGNVHDSSGIYVDTLQTIAGCDSIVTMDLTVNYASVGYDSISACDSVIWNGIVYDSSGTYIDTLVNASGCDSLVTLELIINYTSYTTDSMIAVIALFGMVTSMTAAEYI